MIIKEMPILYREWTVSFDVFPMGTISQFGSILHMMAEEKDHYGYRTPSIYFDRETTIILIASAVNGHDNFQIKSDPISLNQWTMILISQKPEGDNFRYQV